MDTVIKSNEAVETSIHLLDDLFGPIIGDKVGFRLWDGTRWPDERPKTRHRTPRG